MVKLLDPYGRVIPRATFEAARKSRRLKSWIPTDQHINSLLQGSADFIRRRCRQTVRDNPYGANAEEDFCANLIGTGAKPSVLLGDREQKEALQWLWYDWVDEADADGRLDFYGLQTLVARSIFTAGEIFVRFRPRRLSDGLSVPLQLQVLEAEQCRIEDQERLPNGNLLRCGIEFDKIGRRVAYHFYRKHPGDATELEDVGETVRVPASEILHIYQVYRPGQLRGQPRLIPAIVKMFLLDQYDDAELDRKKIAALFAGFIKVPEDLAETVLDEDEDSLAGLEPGTMQKLLPGEDIVFSEPSEVGGSYEAFQYRNLLGISSGLGMPYTNVSGDLRAVNYSSIRAGLINYQRRLRQILFNVIIPQFCKPVWRRWVREALLAQALTGDLYQLQRRVKWIAPKWEWVDPLKEAQATRMKIRCGITSRDHEIEQQGLEPVEVDESQAKGNERADRLGLAYDSDPRRVSNAGVGQEGRARLPDEKGADDET